MTTTPLTPEAVASLTDAELSEAVARVVFQAENLEHYGESEHPDLPFYDAVAGEVVLYTKEDLVVVLDPEWTDATFFVLEHMRQRWAERYDTGEDGYVPYWSITGESDRWSVAAMIDGKDFLERLLGCAIGPSLGRCVFAAAVLAAQEMEKEG